ncbi:MAG: CAP domain-containing protein [Ferruginibacter sp.]
MKKSLIVIIILFFSVPSFCQDWTDEQLGQADTGRDIDQLSEIEKDAIMFINLARLFPIEFVKIELESYTGPEGNENSLNNSTYKKSLVTLLNNSKPVGPLSFDNSLYQNAKCFAKESGIKGTVGHKRKNCPANYSAECCSYGMDNGEDIAMQWLIDDKVQTLGHRRNCLNKAYSKIGISTYSHKKYGTCAVADMSW